MGRSAVLGVTPRTRSPHPAYPDRFACRVSFCPHPHTRLFSASDPSRLLARTPGAVFRPELPFEKSGQYAAGTTFTEGLVRFLGKYFLYYGCADSLVGVAVSPGPPAAN